MNKKVEEAYNRKSGNEKKEILKGKEHVRCV